MTNENIKIRIEDELEWQTEEPNFTPKTTEWFWALGILALALIVFSILLKNYLLIIIIALAGFIIYSNKNKKSELINIRLNNNGLYIENKFYPYDGFESFWIFPTHPERKFALRHNKHLMPLLTVSFHDDDEPQIRKILEKHLPENEEQESLIDLLRKRFF